MVVDHWCFAVGLFVAGDLGALVKKDGIMNSAKYKDISAQNPPVPEGIDVAKGSTFNKMMSQTYFQIKTGLVKETQA